MTEKHTFRNSAGVPFDFHYDGGDHAIAVGKISQGKSLNHPEAILGTLVSGIVVKADDKPELKGKTVKFALRQIDWESQGGFADCVSIRGFGFEIWVHYRSMRLLGSQSHLMQDQIMPKNTTIMTILKSKTDKELLFSITAIFSILFFLVMDIENIFSLWNIVLFLVCLLISFACNRALRQYLR